MSWSPLYDTDTGRAALAHSQTLVLPPPELPAIAPAFDTDYEDLDHALALGARPRTEIGPGNNGTLIISLAEWAGAMIIEFSPTLSVAADWLPLTAPTESQNGVRTLRITPEGTSRFIRLRTP